MQFPVKSYTKGQLIFSEGEVGNNAFIVKSGIVSIFIKRNGKNILVGKITENDVFGHIAPLTGSKRDAGAACSTDVQVWVIDKTSLNKTIESTPLLRGIFHSVVDLLRKTNEYAAKTITAPKPAPQPQPQHIAVTPVAPKPKEPEFKYTKEEVCSGATIFKQGQPGDYAYLLHQGAVDIVIEKKGEKIVVASIGPGEVFGHVAPLTGSPREAAALAKEYSELWVVKKDDLLKAINKNPLLEGLFASFVKMLKKKNQIDLESSSQTHPFISYANIMLLIDKAESSGRNKRQDTEDMAELDMTRVITQISIITGKSQSSVTNIVRRMEDYNLIKIFGIARAKKIAFRTDEIISSAQKISGQLKGKDSSYIHAESEYITPRELAEWVEVDEAAALRALVEKDLFDESVTVSRQAIEEILSEHGKAFFKEYASPEAANPVREVLHTPEENEADDLDLEL